MNVALRLGHSWPLPAQGHLAASSFPRVAAELEAGLLAGVGGRTEEGWTGDTLQTLASGAAPDLVCLLSLGMSSFYWPGCPLEVNDDPEEVWGPGYPVFSGT